MLDNPLLGLMTALLFPVAVLGVIVFLAWLERPHLRTRLPQHLPTHRAGTPAPAPAPTQVRVR
jgi:hypothetical protein